MWLKGLLDQHENFYPEKKADIKRLVVDMLNAWIGSLTSLAESINASSHTIGDESAVSFRNELLKSMKKRAIPWTEECLVYN